MQLGGYELTPMSGNLKSLTPTENLSRTWKTSAHSQQSLKPISLGIKPESYFLRNSSLLCYEADHAISIALLKTSKVEHRLNNHRLKPVGSYYGLKSGYASKTRLLMFQPKVVIYFRLEVMLQIFLDHLVRHTTRGHAKIASRPEMPSPIAFF